LNLACAEFSHLLGPFLIGLRVKSVPMLDCRKIDAAATAL